MINKRKAWSKEVEWLRRRFDNSETIQFPWFTSPKISFLNQILNHLLNWREVCTLNPTIDLPIQCFTAIPSWYFRHSDRMACLYTTAWLVYGMDTTGTHIHISEAFPLYDWQLLSWTHAHTKDKNDGVLIVQWHPKDSLEQWDGIDTMVWNTHIT